MTGEEQIRKVESQLSAMFRDMQSRAISCPYCGGKTEPGKPFCCALLEQTVEAILDRGDLEDRIRTLDQIAENADKEPLGTIN